MKREFFINAVFLISINLLIKPLYIFGIDRTVQNTLGEEVYGIYASLLSFSYLLQIINDFGIQYFNNRNISRNSNLLGKYFPNILFLKVFLSLIYFITTLGIGYFFLGYDSVRIELLLLLAFNQILISFIFYLRSNISGLQHYRLDSMLSALDKLLMILICGVLLFVPVFSAGFRIEWFIYAQTFSYGLTALAAFIILLPHVGKLRFRIRKSFILLILKSSYPYALVVFLMGLYTRIDQVMIERMLTEGAKEAGVYAAAYRLLDASNMIGFLVAGLLLPMFARLIGQGKSVNELLKFSFSALFVITVTVSTFCFFFRYPIMDALYIESEPYWGDILGLLMFSFIAVGSSYVFGTLLSANGSMKGLNIIALVVAILNIILNYFLIMNYGALGAAFATLVTQIMVAIGQIWIARSIFKLQSDFALISKFVLFGLLACVTMWLASTWSPLPWVYSMISGIGICTLFAFWIKLLDLDGFKEMMSFKGTS